jgi:hypothetical protein
MLGWLTSPGEAKVAEDLANPIEAAEIGHQAPKKERIASATCSSCSVVSSG